jgi:hypothetical protein
MRRMNARGPMIPKVMAAIAGPKKAAAASAATCDPATKAKEDTKGRRIDAKVTTTAAAPTIARLARLASVSAPADVWCLHDEARDGGKHHYEADPILRPMLLGEEINREIGSKSLSDIGQKEFKASSERSWRMDHSVRQVR